MGGNLLKHRFLEFPLWFTGVTNTTSIQEEAGSLPGLTQRVKDLEFLGAAV